MDNLEGKALEKSIDLVGDWVNSLVKPSIDVVGEILADEVKLWRFKNQIKILEQAQKYAIEREITIKPIATKNLYQIMEYSSLEEEETLQDMWASLLTNIVDADNKKPTTQIFIQILRQLTSPEVKILNYLYRKRGNYSDFHQECEKVSWISSSIGENENDTYIYVDNLKRLELVRFLDKEEIKELEEGSSEVQAITTNAIFSSYKQYDGSEVGLTDFGADFINACKINKPKHSK